MNHDEMKAHNLATYGTNDPELIGMMVQRAWEEKQKRESTFGGYLRALRRGREMTEGEMAAKAGVSRSTWLNWEANGLTPTPEELDAAMRQLQLSPIKRERLEELLAEVPRQKLRNLAFIRVEKMAARGLATFEAELEREVAGSELWEQLSRWSQAKGLDFPRGLLAYARDIESEDELEAWIDEVLTGNRHAL